jgi:ubiquinone/menaquinone biosynthesis C-methylase UbiE
MSIEMKPNIGELRQAYSRGDNITQLLTNSNPNLDRSEIIEIAYDIQSGSYTKYALESSGILKRYASEICDLAKPYLAEHDVILDCGAGELTTLSALSEHLPAQCQLLACDISLSRLKVGRRFAERVMRGDLARALRLFVADMGRLPIADSSVDVVFTSHALEPNHGRERDLLAELLRVARRQLLLFEPSWENADELVRTRMEQHGYVRDLPQHIDAAGGRLVSVEPLPNSLNSVNPTYCYVVEPVNKESQPSFADQAFQCPRSGYPYHKQQSYWWNQEGGWAYPEIDGIACLREKHGVLMSHA